MYQSFTTKHNTAWLLFMTEEIEQQDLPQVVGATENMGSRPHPPSGPETYTGDQPSESNLDLIDNLKI